MTSIFIIRVFYGEKAPFPPWLPSFPSIKTSVSASSAPPREKFSVPPHPPQLSDCILQPLTLPCAPSVMALYLEFDRIVRQFAKARLRYAVAGGLAVGLHGHIRATKDMDFLIHDRDVPK